MKKVLVMCVTAAVVLTGVTNAATTTVWNPAANGIYPPDAGLWSDGANWTGGTAPEGDYKGVYNAGGAGFVD